MEKCLDFGEGRIIHLDDNHLRWEGKEEFLLERYQVGMFMNGVHLMANNPCPSDEEIIESLFMDIEEIGVNKLLDRCLPPTDDETIRQYIDSGRPFPGGLPW